MPPDASLEALIDRYCQGWSHASPQERERLIRETLAEDAWYCDPRTGHRLRIPELLAHIAAVHESRPGAKVLRTSRVDAHHGWARFAWRVVLPDGSALAESMDVVELDEDGARLQSVLGFFGPLHPIPGSAG